MATANKLISSLVFILVAAIGSNAQQDSRGTIAQPLTLTVTAAATGERVRFTAPSSIVQLQLEVYNSEGRRVFDDELRGANVLDWHLQDGQAERLPDGTYLCVVTVKSLSGKITQKMAGLVVEGTGGRLQAVSGEQLTAQQARSVGPV